MSFLLLDLETVVDYDRIHKCDGLPGEGREESALRVLSTLKEQVDTTDSPFFIPARYHKPVVACFILIDGSFDLVGYHSFSGHDKRQVIKDSVDAITDARRDFESVLVTFNGNRFDMPVIEIGALESGILLPDWFRLEVPTYDNPRSRFAERHHLDMFQLMAGNSTLGGGLDFWSRLVGFPGKTGSGDSVIASVSDDKWQDIIDYCMCDVLNTLGVFASYMQQMSQNFSPFHPKMRDIINAIDGGDAVVEFKRKYNEAYGSKNV